MLSGIGLSLISCPAGEKLMLALSHYSLRPGWEFHKLQGVDSCVREFVGDGARLNFDFGRWSNPFDEAHEPKYAVVEESISGYRAKIVFPRAPGQGLTGIYFPKITEGNKLCLYGQDLSASQQALALEIFRTIRFGEPERE